MNLLSNKQSAKHRALARPISLFTAFAALVAMPVAALVLAAPAIVYAQVGEKSEEEGVERAEMSQLADVRLPDGAYRSTNLTDLTKFDDALQKIAQTNHGKMTKTETLIWRDGDRDRAMKELSARLKDAGYNYATSQAFDAEPGHVTPFASVTKNKPGGLFGLWIETKNKGGGYTLLVWGQFEPNDSAAPGHIAPPEQSAPASVTAPEPLTVQESPQERQAAASPKSDASTAAVPTKAPVKSVAKTAPKTNGTNSQKRTVAANPKTKRPLNASERQAEAARKLKDYNYVKYFGPISGPMYRSSKW